MAEIKVTLSQDEVLKACEYWAVNRVLNEGYAVSTKFHLTKNTADDDVELTSVTVWVDTKQNAAAR